MPTLPAAVLILLCLVCWASPVRAEGLVGGSFEYSVVKGDYLTRIGARFGVDAGVLAEENGLDYAGHLHPGQRIRVDNRHIVPPDPVDDGVLINVPQRLLFLFRSGRLVAHYPVGLGQPDWPTPLGRRTIRSKEVDKEWIVPESIQAEMADRGQEVIERLPPGPGNPLGRHWIGIRPGNWGLHSTIAPASVYAFRSHGCIRLHPDDAAELFGRVETGDAVHIVYRPLLLGRSADGRVYLEVHPDVYGRSGPLRSLLRQEAARQGLLGQLDWPRVEPVLRRRAGVAREVGPVLVAAEPGTDATE